MNVLKPHLQTTIETLLEASASQRQIERLTGIDRKTIRTYQQRFAVQHSNFPGVATGSGPINGLGLRALPRIHRDPAQAQAQLHGDLCGLRVHASPLRCGGRSHAGS